MDSAAWLVYLWTLGTVLITPGTSVLLVVSQALHAGRPAVLWTVAGDLTANAVQIATVAVAASAVVETVALYGGWLKWCAVGFLAMTGLRLLAGATLEVTPVSRKSAFTYAFSVSMTNPAAILFFAMLLPLFVSESAPALPQFAALGIVALLLDGLVLCAYGGATIALGHRLGAAGGFSTRCAGALRLGAAALLATAI